MPRRIFAALALLLAGCAATPGASAPTQALAPTVQAAAPTATAEPPPASGSPAPTVTAAPTATAAPPPASGSPAPTATSIPPTIVQAPSPTSRIVRPTATPAQANPPAATRPATSAPAPAPTETPIAPIEASPADPVAPPVAAAYVFPVQPAAVVQYGACHHDYPASDMFAPIGSQFVAPTGGVVDWVTRTDVWDAQVNDPPTRGGLSVAIIGDDGVRYYGSHLSAVADGIEPGVRVGLGQLLGLTGKSGDAVGTPPHLHFGISRPTTPEDWAVRRGQINPYPYLNAWRKGENLAPDLNVVGGGAC